MEIKMMEDLNEVYEGGRCRRLEVKEEKQGVVNMDVRKMD